MNNSAATSSAGAFRKATARDAAVLLAMAWLVPFLVHLVPWGAARPLGAYVLPMFWTTFVALYFYGVGLGLLTALFAPAINLAATGLPGWKFLTLMSVELVIFTLVLAWAIRLAPRFWLLAPIGYLVAKVASTSIQSATTVFGDIGAPVRYLSHSIANSAAGLVILAAINLVLVRLYPKADAPA